MSARKVRVEDVLAAIHELRGNTASKLVRSGAIAKRLDVAPGTVSPLLVQFAEDGLIEHIPYEGAKLTADGELRVAIVLRRRGIVEVWLNQFLRLNPVEAAAEAVQIERVVTQKLIEALDAALGFPQMTPSGITIPRA